MSTELIITLTIAVPVILFPAAFVWFINITGLLAVWKADKSPQRSPRQHERE